MDKLEDILKNKKKFKKQFLDRHKYVTKEFQDYGYRIALKLDELDSVSLYIKLAKEKPRQYLEEAFRFAIDYPNAKSKGRIFMWKLKEIEKERAKDELEPEANKKGKLKKEPGTVKASAKGKVSKEKKNESKTGNKTKSK